MIKNWKYVLGIVSSFAVTSAYSQSLKDAQQATDLERYRNAINNLQTINRSSPSEEAALSLADAYLKVGKPDSAAIYLNQAAANPKSEVGMVAAGKAALLKGNASAAEEQFEKAIKASKKKDPNIYMLIAQAYVDANVKDPTKAIEYINRANELTKNNNAEAYITLGNIHQLSPNGGGPAMTAYDRAVQIDSKNAKAHFKRGQLFVRSRNYNEAQSALQAALAANPNYAPAYRELGEMYYFAGKYDQALENYRKFTSMAENTSETRAKFASFLFLTKDYAGTIKEAQEVLKRDPNNQVMNRVLAYSLYETDKNEEAIKAMENYFKVADQSKILGSDYAYYGRMLAQAGKNDLAQTNFDKALQLDPENTELMDDIASFYAKQKSYDKAIPLYTKILDSNPKSPNVVRIKLANTYFENKQYDQADPLYASVLTTNPTYVPALVQRAEIIDAKDTDKSGDAKNAYEEVIKVINQDPAKQQSYKGTLVAINYKLGFYAYQAKDYTNARKNWSEVLRLDPGNKEATQGIKSIDAMQRRK